MCFDIHLRCVCVVHNQLQALGGRATLVQANKLQPAQLVLDLCAGHRVVITRHVPSSMQVRESVAESCFCVHVRF